MGDAGTLAALHARAFERPWDAAAIAGLLSSGAAGVMTPDGFILWRTAAGESEILTLAVEPAARRQGLGRVLVEAAAKGAKTAGAAALFLEVAEDNAAAITLYQSTGFAEAGRRRGYYKTARGPVDALVLSRALNR